MSLVPCSIKWISEINGPDCASGQYLTLLVQSEFSSHINILWVCVCIYIYFYLCMYGYTLSKHLSRVSVEILMGLFYFIYCSRYQSLMSF